MYLGWFAIRRKRQQHLYYGRSHLLVAAVTFVVGLLLVREMRGADIDA